MTITTLATITGALLVIQLALPRPRLNRHSNQVLASASGQETSRSHAHHAFIVLEALKVAALVALACYLLAA